MLKAINEYAPEHNHHDLGQFADLPRVSCQTLPKRAVSVSAQVEDCSPPVPLAV